MKKHITKSLFLILLMIGATACSEDYFEVNTPSGTVNEDQLRMNDLLAPVIHSTMEGQYSAELTFGNYVQNFVSQQGGAVGETQASGLWSQIYLYVLPNIKIIKEKAAAENAIHFGAVADVLTAINLGIATDTWDNIPYSQANLGQENLFPAFDTQEEIYAEIFNLLDNAIAALQATDDSGIFVGNEDLIYRGDLDQWLRAAYTLKARYQLRMVGNGSISATEVLNNINNGFTSNDDDFQMHYDDRNINPWYSGEILARATGNFYHDIASQIVSTMNGDYYPFQSGALTIDPRLPVFATNGGEEEWKGFVSGGGGLAPDGTSANAQFVDGGYFTRIDAPLVLITYAEAQFIKAEAAFLANGGNETSVGSTSVAYEAYLEGISASMNKYGVDGSDYLADGVVAVGEGGLMLNHIMKEKYIHNFLNPETFVDYRRYDFSDEVFVGLTIREEDDSEGDYAGEWFRRATYPSSELIRNEDVVLANQQLPTTPVGWDE
ncbi:SusD-like starch-binding protein associating with outer membrane [Winogradskyella epiphytica]|uniref:SusD-like starch-binding protein associating with outer membrane n=1 Tax=Winogradskyella epiphytica TaxID=262005 RepID=A0A2V4XMR7_9FLAO|nr:SusD/RagB family nutrient-binding outer membrane lipoprotein [Winogradskyella epiphytica]PYE83379.1 SusD-like starch-binding protein associating with outer membrane [Winogradskyella epiphytica]